MGLALRAICIGILACALFLGAPSTAFTQEQKKVKKPVRASCSAGASAALARYKVETGEALPVAIPKPLTLKAGDSERGLEATVNPGKGNCLACHNIAKVLAMAEENDPKSIKTYGNNGEVGPPLNGVGARYSQAELRMIVVDPRKAFPDADTVMPAYHARAANKDVSRACRGRVMLSAQSVEDIVAFLEQLK